MALPTSALKRCTRCIYPVTRPDAHFDEHGVCSACRSYDQRKTINWDLRLQALKDLIAEAKARKAPYDAVVPISGGKDSTAQVLKCIELGAKVLAVNGATDMLSDIGRRNLDNIKRFCDVIEVTPHIEVRKKLVRAGLHNVGDPSWPEHNVIWAAPTRMAVQMGIPLCVWGEQPQREYSAPEGVEPATNLDAAWVSQFGGMCGLRLSDMVGWEGLTARDLDVFRFPSDAAMNKAGVKGIWLGDHIDWDGWKNAFIAQHYGFEFLPHPVATSLGNYENLDNHLTVIRDFLRFLKFGYTRGTDIACSHIRRGRLTRDEALRLEATTVSFPRTSLGKPIEDVLAYFGLTLINFQGECQRWMNRDIFEGFDSDWSPIMRQANDAGDAHHPRAA